MTITKKDIADYASAGLVLLSGATAQSGINSVINGQGNPATKQSTKQMVLEYPQDNTAAN